MRILSYLFIMLLVLSCKLQKAEKTVSQPIKNQQKQIYTQPKLVVGIVVDQMRYDYITRFYNHYGNGGFKRLINQGFNCKNNHYNYVPTYTGPGHASTYTGTTPKMHGIIANNWYDKFKKQSVYCAEDTTVQSVGTTSNDGQMSPKRMLTTSFADENRLFTQLKGKTIGISIKDRGAILPAGHTANAAYWFRGKEEGNFITSTYYMKALPNWVTAFNASNVVENYIKEWNTLKPISTYIESGADLNNFERSFKGKDEAVFPYNLKELKTANKGFDILKTTPYGNSIVTDFALAALEGEHLGEDAVTDVLAISYSSTDYIGHSFGVNSKEIQDTYIRLDKELEKLLNALDEKVGKNAYTLFLTSDHGAVEVPAYLKSKGIPAGYFDADAFKERLNAFLTRKFGSANIIEDISNYQLFFNKDVLAAKKLNLETVQQAVVNEVINYPHIYKAYTAKTLHESAFTEGVEALLKNGYNQKRSGDVILVLEPAVIAYSKKGSTHGSALNYDTHVPLVFYGKGIKKGATHKKTEIIDIAPTISALLGISFPNGATGNVIYEVLE